MTRPSLKRPSKMPGLRPCYQRKQASKSILSSGQSVGTQPKPAWQPNRHSGICLAGLTLDRRRRTSMPRSKS